MGYIDSSRVIGLDVIEDPVAKINKQQKGQKQKASGFLTEGDMFEDT